MIPWLETEDSLNGDAVNIYKNDLVRQGLEWARILSVRGTTELQYVNKKISNKGYRISKSKPCKG